MKVMKLDKNRDGYNIEDYCYGIRIDDGLIAKKPSPSYANSTIALLSDDVYEWLTTHVGHGHQDGWWVPDCDWMWIITPADLDPIGRSGTFENWIMFKDTKAAMLFKLTFG